MKVVIDAHGGDLGLKPNIEGALDFLKENPDEIILTGRDSEIREVLRSLGISSLPQRLSIIDAPQIVEMDGEPVEECRKKPNSSLVTAADLVAEKKADAMISAGNSGAIMVAALLKIKRIKGVSRPAIAVPYPTEKGYSLLLDAGANMDSKPWHLVQFAVMGSIYMKNMASIENPKVGILSIGEEECKGNSLVLETIPLLKKAPINFYGPIEGRDLPFGLTDVVVTDGFTGNVALKLSEGLAKFLFKSIKDRIKGKFTYAIGAMLMKKIFYDMKAKTNPDEFGGAPLLGINGVVLVSHGKTSPKAIKNAAKKAAGLASCGYVEKIRKEAEAMKEEEPEAESGASA
ncbi:MAG: phosphate acyltransferase PlsX [Elusimicrobia bacterium]|nr:phosphate acyltransferase PlsX [Elusimicrobiota bacterium]